MSLKASYTWLKGTVNIRVKWLFKNDAVVYCLSMLTHMKVVVGSIPQCVTMKRYW